MLSPQHTLPTPR